MFTRRAIPSAFRAATRASTARPVPSARFLTPFQARLLSDEVRSAIDRAVASSPVVLFMKGTPETPQCGFSRATIQILGMQGVDPEKFTAFNVLEDQDLRQGIKEYSEWPTIPQLYVDKEFVGGCDILMSMHQDGSLAKMLEEKGVVVPAEGQAPMEVERTEPALQARGNMDLPAKKTLPPRVKKTILTASVFKRQKSNIDQGNSTIQATLRNSKLAGGDADATALLIAKSHSNSRNAVETGAKKGFLKKHPLGVAFRDASDKYRGHLYHTTSLKITKTLESLLHNLYKSTPQTIAPNSSQQDFDASPPKLSALAQYERLATQLYQPISQFKLSLRRIDSKGRNVRFVQTLETRMLHYDELIAKETTKLGTLQKEWEFVVSEIWKVGTTCLGDEAMTEMLFTEEGLHEQTSPPSPSPSKATDAGSTLFIPENGTSSPRYKPRVGKKSVTFQEEEEEASGVCNKYDATSTSQFPNFIYQPSGYRNDTLPRTPSFSEDKTKELEKMIEELGKQEMDEFRKIEKEHQAYWKRKTAQLASALKSD